MTTFGDQVRQFGGAPVNGPLSLSGDHYFVRPGSGADTNNGKKPSTAFASLSQALSVVPADRNNVIWFDSEDNTASGTTDYLSSALTVSVDGITIQGVNSGSMYSQRSRIAANSSASALSPLVTWSANNSSMRNVQIFHGQDSASALIAFRVSGDRNYFYRCHFAGMGNTSGTQDAAGAASLSLQGSENVFEECVIGLDTVARGTAANSELRFDGTGAARNVFKNCLFVTYAEAGTHQFVLNTATSLDRYQIFDNCIFYNAVDSAGTNMSEAFSITAPTSPAGGFILKDCSLYGASEWATGDSGVILVAGAASVAGTAGSGQTGVAVEPT